MGEFITQDELEAVRELLQLITSNGLGELSVTLAGGTSISIATHSAAVSAQPVIYASLPANNTGPAASAPVPLPSSDAASANTLSQNRTAMPSPMVGIFYSSPSPGEPPFVVPGDKIQIGQTIGLIEAMKVFSEIPSDIAGLVVELSAQNGDLVQLGQPLLYVEPA